MALLNVYPNGTRIYGGPWEPGDPPGIEQALRNMTSITMASSTLHPEPPTAPPPSPPEKSPGV